MKDVLMKLMDEYFETFGDHFPNMCFQTASDDEMAQMIRECILSNKTAEDLYELDYERNVY